MMNKEVYLKNVAESLALLSREVSILNAVNLYDINIVAEDFFPGLLNLIYGYELKNANYLEKNAPAIDLVDPKNRIAVQVTSDNSSTKIKHTIEEFNKNKETVMICPAQGFYSSEKLGKNEIRLAYILNEKDLTTAAKLLKEGLKEYLSLKIKSFNYKNDELPLS